MDPLGMIANLIDESLKLKTLFDQGTSDQRNQLRLIARDIHRALEKLRHLICDHQDRVDASHLRDSLSQLQSDLFLTKAKCVKPRPLQFFATSEQHKALKRLQASVAKVILILDDDSPSLVPHVGGQTEEQSKQEEARDLIRLASPHVVSTKEQISQLLNSEDSVKVQANDVTVVIERIPNHEPPLSPSDSRSLVSHSAGTLNKESSCLVDMGQQPNNSVAKVWALPPPHSDGVDTVQHALNALTIQSDNEDAVSSLDSNESNSCAVSDFSLLSYPSKEAGDQHSHNIHLRKVAASTTNVAYQFSTFSRNEEALSLYREAVDIRRQIALQGDELYLYELTESLHQLAHHLRLMKRDEEGIVLDSEVVDIRRELVSRNPEEYLSSLAKGVHMLGHIHNCVERPKEGLPFIQEEVEIYRKLFAEQSSYQADLAQALHCLAHQLRLVGRLEDGIIPDLEALQLLRGFSDPH